VIALDVRWSWRKRQLYDEADYATGKMSCDARNLIDHLGLSRADVLGYSMGARIATWLALDHPGRVRS
jgi:pimeloyl-ACP methyl ester carboxylesterase